MGFAWTAVTPALSPLPRLEPLDGEAPFTPARGLGGIRYAISAARWFIVDCGLMELMGLTGPLEFYCSESFDKDGFAYV